MKGSSLERFAQEARIQLQKEVKARLNLIQKGDASIDLIENSNAVNALRKHLEDLKGNEDALVEEVAYTWFNRISALRFMDASGYNPTLIVSPAEGKTLPEILSEALSGIIDEDVFTSTKDQNRIHGLVDGTIASKNPQAEIYRILLVASCNHLNQSLPLLFEKIEDYTDLLLPDDLLSSESIITKTVNAISAEDVQSVEIIGWLYQYYISEKKDEVFAAFKKGKKASKDEIPAATQLFTPEWIVRYLVENSLGRLWMLNHPASSLKTKMKYYIDPVDKETDFIRLSSPEEIKVLDPCCGSGHMLTYAFDLLFDIYTECGYTDNDAVKHIIEDNLYGIEIDRRAGQLAYFALMMKARERSRRILRKGISPNICILQKVEFDKEELPNVINLFENPSLIIMNLMNDFKDADILGSLITPSISNIAFLKNTLKADQNSNDMFSDEYTLTKRVKTVLDQAEYLARKYHVVVTNPPYMGNSHMGSDLKTYIEGNFKEYKYDLFSAFFIRCCSFGDTKGYLGFMSPYVWMFISSYENLRRTFIERKTITSLAQLEYSAFADATVPLCIFTLKNTHENNKGVYFRLTEFTGGMDVQDKKILEAINNHNCGYYFEVSADQFEKIPGSPIAYWASTNVINDFTKSQIKTILTTREGMATADNDRFLRLWPEVDSNKISFPQTIKSPQKFWIPYSKGGDYRKWYGNNDYVVNWKNDGYEIKHNIDPKTGRIRSHNYNGEFGFLEGISWTALSSSDISVRYCQHGFLFDSKGSKGFSKTIDDALYCMGVINSNVGTLFLRIISPTIDFHGGYIEKIPYIDEESDDIIPAVLKCKEISKADWDSFETSWDFSIHPLLDMKIIETESFYFEDDKELQEYMGGEEYSRIFHSGIDGSRRAWSPIEFAYLRYKDWANKAFFHLKKNEEELNRIFIDIYGLQDELTPEEDVSMVSVHRIFDNKSEIPESMRKGQYALTKEDVVKSFISYVVGCMFGRYDADSPGLAYAGGDFDISSYSGFVPDSDNVIPVLGDSWFKNDAETYFIKFVEKQFGHDTLNENLRFIENALGKSIREYFYKDFYKEHLKTYQKRPIYWMFSSPKGYFQALVYMHRYNENTANKVLECLRDFRTKIGRQIQLADEAGEAKKKVEYENIDKDLNDYEVNILYPLAIQHLTFDLDDGVKVNYQKLGKALKAIK